MNKELLEKIVDAIDEYISLVETGSKDDYFGRDIEALYELQKKFEEIKPDEDKRVLVVVRGGIVQDVKNNYNLNVKILDYDCLENSEDEDVTLAEKELMEWLETGKEVSDHAENIYLGLVD